MTAAASRRIVALGCAGLAAATVFFLADLAGVILFENEMDIGSFLIPLYFGLAATALTAISAGLGLLASWTIGWQVPRAARIAWGGLVGVLMCLILDLPNPDFDRLLPYVVALIAGVSVSLVYDQLKPVSDAASFGALDRP